MKWFYNSKGQLKGPFETDSIKELILNKELGADDLVFEESFHRWRVLSEVNSFKALFKDKLMAKKIAVDPSWVVLKKDKKSSQRKQVGPYKTEVLKSLLQSGTLSLSDYIWRPGMKQWYRVTSFPELLGPHKPAAQHEIEEATEQATEELLSQVLVQSDLIAAPEEYAEDLGGSTASHDAKDDIPDEPDEGLFTKTSKLKKLESIKQNHYWLQTWSPLVLCFLLLIGAAFLLRNKIFEMLPQSFVKLASKQEAAEPQKTLSHIETAPSQKASPPVKSLQVKAKVKPPAAPTPAPYKEPSYLKLSYSSSDGSLTLQTDATDQIKGKAIFTSRMGSLLGAKSYYRSLNKVERRIDLEQLPWPEGLYEVQVQLGSISSQRRVYIGKSAKTYPQRLKNYKKVISQDFMGEKVAYIRDLSSILKALGGLQSLLENQGTLKTSDLRSWRIQLSRIGSSTLKNIGPKSRNNFVLAQEWLELRSDKSELMSLALSTDPKLAASINEAKATANQYEKKLLKAEREAQSLSLWR